MVQVFSFTSDGRVLCAVAVGVADEACLPVVVQLGVGDGDTSDAVGEVKETIIATLNVIKLPKTM